MSKPLLLTLILAAAGTSFSVASSRLAPGSRAEVREERSGGPAARASLLSRDEAGDEGGQATAASSAAAFVAPSFELPPGLEAVVAAAPPLVRHPVMASFDDRGRLFVCDNAGLNLNKEELEAQKPNCVRLLEDTDGDGIFDKSTVFADAMTFPQGALWLMGSLYVMSPPSLWRLEDTTGDGVADTREELVTGFDYTGNAADVHGPFLHPDGRIYWCHGRKGHEVRDPRTGEMVSQGKGARIWSCLPDGSDVQVFAGGGMDNPVEIDFTETGEILGTVNLFHGRPRSDTIVHWLRGGAYPRHDQEAVLEEFIRTGPLLPPVHDFGHVGISGMTLYRTGHLDAAWKDNVLAAHFNTQTVTRTELQPAGASFRAGRTETIFKAGSPDSHITDVLEDPSGDLLVIDTGGWFRIGCPTSQVAKPDVPGAIYRVRRAAGERPAGEDPFGRGFDWENATAEAIAAKLDHPSFAVRERARVELAVQGAPALPELEMILTEPAAHSVMARRNAVWTLARMRFSEAPELLLAALDDADATVRQAACQAIAATRDWRSVSDNLPDVAQIEIERNHRIVRKLLELAQTGEPPVQRSAAEALGRMADPAVVGPLLGVAGREDTDRSLEHAAIYALIQIGDAEGTRRGLEGDNPRRQSAALVALDQMGALEPLILLPFLDHADPGLRESAVRLAASRPDFDAALASRFFDWLDEGQLAPARLETFAALAPVFLGTPPMQSLAGQALASPDEALAEAAFRAIAAADAPGFHESWSDPFAGALARPADPLAAVALEALANTGSREFDPALQGIAADEDVPPVRRVLALRALGQPNSTLSLEAFALLKDLAGSGSAPLERLDAVRLIAASRLSPTQLAETVELVGEAGPMELPVLLDAFGATSDPEIGAALAAAVAVSPGAGAADPGELDRLFNRFPHDVRETIAPVVAGLRERREQQAVRLAELESRLAEGDPERGREVFLTGKGACLTCHQVGEDGRAVGPDLSTIGRIRGGRDLLESILYPSESIARDFESYQVSLKDGGLVFGMIQRETADAIYLTDPVGNEMTLARSAVAKVESSALSLMPQGLELALSEQELLDLVAFLQARK